jgi:hypothetical protein
MRLWKEIAILFAFLALAALASIFH